MARWHSCNVLLAGAQSHQLWQFTAVFSAVIEVVKETSSQGVISS